MVENIYLRVLCVLLIAPTAIRGLDIIGDTFGVVANAVCAAMSGKDIENCANDFNEELQSIDNQPLKELQTRKLCCALNHLRDCIIDSIGDKCGDNPNSIVTTLVSGVVGAAKMSTGQDCRTYNGNTGKVLCLNGIFNPNLSFTQIIVYADYVLILILIGLILLFLSVCCATIRMCCGSGRRYRASGRGSAQFMLLPQTNGDKNRY